MNECTKGTPIRRSLASLSSVPMKPALGLISGADGGIERATSSLPIVNENSHHKPSSLRRYLAYAHASGSTRSPSSTCRSQAGSGIKEPPHPKQTPDGVKSVGDCVGNNRTFGESGHFYKPMASLNPL